MDIKKNTIVNDDILNVLPFIPNKTFDLVLTDMPYQQEAHGRGLSSKRPHLFKEMAEYTNLDNDWYNESILSEYVRICKFPNMFLFCGKRDVYKCLKFAVDNGLEYWIIPLCKKSPLPFVNNTWLSSEFAVHIVDRKLTYTTNYDWKIPYFFIGGNRSVNHPNAKDKEMVKKVIYNITDKDGFVFDGFMGSGTTAVACMDTGRRFFGCEINEKYYNLARQRIEEAYNYLDLFTER